ncbi:RNA polymerase sigma factor [Crocinitomix algicola]|uniref:RNA polymerase sigma factor n=1 Tax=Crocinitomix algicola TaxID=1740263 RepID=UPI001FE221CD|nr:RNA polymerase sigma factor [Crocinitomix algicola]
MESVNMTEEQLVKECISGNAKAQKTFYDLFARKMMGVCLRYTKDPIEAQDVLQDGFVKVFTKLPKFVNKGSLEGWVRRIMVNTALDQYRKNKKFQRDVEIDSVSFKLEKDDFIVEAMNAEDLLKIIQSIPEGYRIVFNLFAIEGYSHKEIAQQLGVTESTSKSQYSRAKKMLRKLLVENNLVEEGER